MPLDLESLSDLVPPGDGAPWTCAVVIGTTKWPYAKRCDELAIGRMPLELADAFDVSEHDRMICEEHALAAERDIPDDSPLTKFIKE